MPAMVVATSAKTESRSCSRYRGASFSEMHCAAVVPSRPRSMIRDRHVDDPTTVVRKDHKDKKQPERHGGHDEQVGSHDLARMIGEEGPPRLGRRPRMPPHVRRDRRLTYGDPQLVELAVNPRCAPKWICWGHLANQCADIGWHVRPPRAMSALPRPEQAKAATMPGENRRWLHDMKCRAPAGPSLRQPRPQQTIDSGEAKSWTAGTIRNGQLVSKGDDLQMQSRTRTDQQPDEWRNETRTDTMGRAYSERLTTSIVTGRTAFW